MSHTRKKPGVAFWATVVVVVVLVAYPLSFGPACWLFKWGILSESRLRSVYAPILDHEAEIPRGARRFAAWYSGPPEHERDMIAFLNRSARLREALNRQVEKLNAVLEKQIREQIEEMTRDANKVQGEDLLEQLAL